MTAIHEEAHEVSVPRRGKLMDAKQIMAEYGITRAMADSIIRWCHEHASGAVRPVDGTRKLFVYRADVEKWERESNTRNAA